MTNFQAWFKTQSAKFREGYDAYCRCEPNGKTMSSEWQRGWLYAAEQQEP